MDRKWKTEYRNERFCFQFTVAERKALEQLAEDDGEWNLSAVVRRLIREEGRRRGLWPPKKEEDIKLEEKE